MVDAASDIVQNDSRVFLAASFNHSLVACQNVKQLFGGVGLFFHGVILLLSGVFLNVCRVKTMLSKKFLLVARGGFGIETVNDWLPVCGNFCYFGVVTGQDLSAVGVGCDMGLSVKALSGIKSGCHFPSVSHRCTPFVGGELSLPLVGGVCGGD
jgi:hypothetical protein